MKSETVTSTLLMKIERSTDYQYRGALEVHNDKEAAFSAVYSPRKTCRVGPGTADVPKPQRRGHHGPGSMGPRGSPRAAASSPHTVGNHPHAVSQQRTRSVPPHAISQALQHVAAAIPESFAKNDSCNTHIPLMLRRIANTAEWDAAHGPAAAVGGETEGALPQRRAAAVSPEHLGQMDPVMQLEAGGLGDGQDPGFNLPFALATLAVGSRALLWEQTAKERKAREEAEKKAEEDAKKQKERDRQRLAENMQKERERQEREHRENQEAEARKRAAIMNRERQERERRENQEAEARKRAAIMNRERQERERRENQEAEARKRAAMMSSS
ncbi:Hypp737 [Branchiostoma lanceolatum]|uniref:Hypp737 protein n=1 Tax=Branchiostoma lanceolatum TaxID=7740 RepID=A0A8J9VCW7_BRALA|nr:Hypp737 [Branchiostoma lanceolatum]